MYQEWPELLEASTPHVHVRRGSFCALTVDASGPRAAPVEATNRTYSYTHTLSLSGHVAGSILRPFVRANSLHQKRQLDLTVQTGDPCLCSPLRPFAFTRL